jgi:hypothetical protein
MRTKKTLAFIIVTTILVTIALGTIPNRVAHANTTARPRFENLSSDPQSNGLNFQNGTLITVEYSVYRYSSVNGVIIVGSGSNLSIDINDGLELNFSHSLRDRSYYTGTFNLTENTYFKGYGWIGEITNGTYEEVDDFAHLGPWHYLFVNEYAPPEFDNIINATSTGVTGVYYSPANQTNHTIVIRYRVYRGSEDDEITLAVSSFRDKISNASLNIFDSDVQFIKMNWVNESHSTYVVFNTSIILTERTIYFSANNSYGWDTWQGNVVQDTLNIYKINNGFHFESKTILNELHTDVDPVNIKITAINNTLSETYGVGYYVLESPENRSEIIPWTLVEATLNDTYNETNENNYNNTVSEYLVSLGTFEIDNLVYFEAYNIYKGEYYNETTGILHLVKIYDSIPHLTLSPKNESYTNNATVTFTYAIDLARGNITGVLFDYGDGTPLDSLILNETNTISHNYPSDVTTVYEFTLFVNNSLGKTNNITNIIYLDFNGPDVEITAHSNNTGVVIDGYVELYFNYSDDYSGVKLVWIYWDDGTVQNVTGDYYAYHYYLESGDYNITILTQDKAGNNYSVSISYVVELPIYTTPDQTSFGWFAILLSILTIGVILKRNKKKQI